MTLKENIKAILECNFSMAKDEVIEATTKRIMEQIYRQEFEAIICELRNRYPSMPIFSKRKWEEENKAYLDCESIIFNHISELKGE